LSSVTLVSSTLRTRLGSHLLHRHSGALNHALVQLLDGCRALSLSRKLADAAGTRASKSAQVMAAQSNQVNLLTLKRCQGDAPCAISANRGVIDLAIGSQVVFQLAPIHGRWEPCMMNHCA
jgi:hypothetical protein